MPRRGRQLVYACVGSTSTSTRNASSVGWPSATAQWRAVYVYRPAAPGPPGEPWTLLVVVGPLAGLARAGAGEG